MLSLQVRRRELGLLRAGEGGHASSQERKLVCSHLQSPSRVQDPGKRHTHKSVLEKPPQMPWPSGSHTACQHTLLCRETAASHGAAWFGYRPCLDGTGKEQKSTGRCGAGLCQGHGDSSGEVLQQGIAFSSNKEVYIQEM